MTDQVRTSIAQLHRRAGFGLHAAELDQLAVGGYQSAVETLLAGLGSAADPAGDGVALPSFTPYQRPTAAPGTPPAQAQNRARNQGEKTELVALQNWWMDRMIVTSTPLREKLTLFWHGHFATGASKVRDAKLMYLQNELFRTSGAGGFDALTQAVAKDGAMMVWLDTSTDLKAHPNENFAREMMELFTLGIGNYTQADVTAAAAAFTGWAYSRADYEYVFRPRQHDDSTKTYLGHTGDWNGNDIIDLAVNEPYSARFVLAKLWSHFAYPVQPSDQVVGDLLPAYGSGLDVTAALEAMFLHPAFLSPASSGGLVKQPIEYLVGAARALGLDSALNPISGQRAAAAATAPARQARSLAALATALGQAPFNPPNVGGWGQNAYWLDTATAELRLDAGLVLASRADLSAVAAAPAAQRPDTVAELLGLDGWGSTTSAALQQMAGHPVQLTALALASPEYVLA